MTSHRGVAMKHRIAIIAVLAMAGSLMVPVLPASADQLGIVLINEGKAFVQCPNPVTGLTFPFVPTTPTSTGTNKGKKCMFTFGSSNSHKAGLPVVGSILGCTAVSLNDTLKKGDDKPLPIGVGTSKGGMTGCSITATGMVGPRLKTLIPAPPPPIGPGGTTFAGPWCGASQGHDGTGTISTGGVTGSKTITFERLRFQSQGTNIIFTASAIKDASPPDGDGQTQAGPVVGLVNARNDEHKLAGGTPKSSCLSNNKNFKVDGVAITLLMGNK